MNPLAARIRESFEQLVDQYAERLLAYPDYAALPLQARREAAQRPLLFMVDWLDSGDDAQLRQFIHTVAATRLAQGFDISVMLNAIQALGELLEPLATEIESAKRLWAMLLKAQEAVTEFVTDLLRQDIAKREQAEKSLTEWQRRYELVTSVTRQVVYDYDVASGAIVWSGNIEQVLGFQLSEMDGGVEQWGSLIHPDDREQAFALLDAAQAACGPYHVEYRFRCRDGSYLWMEDSGLFIPDASGQAVRMIGMMTDISARKQAEAALQANEERLSLALEAGHVGIWEFWPQKNGVYFNPTWYTMLGYAPYEMPQALETWAQLLHPEDAPRANEIVTASIQAGTDFVVQFRLKTKSGEWRWMQARGYVTMRTAEGSAERIIGTHTDIHEQKSTEEALKAAVARLRNIIDALPLGMHFYRLEPDGRLVFTGANPTANKLLGVDNRIFIGKTIEETFPALIETEVPARYRAAAAEGISWQTQQISYAEGEIQGAFEVYAFQISPGEMAAVFMDVTERLRAEVAIRTQQERLQSITANIPGVVYQFYVLPTGEMGVDYVSERITQIFGLDVSLTEFFPAFVAHVHPEDVESFMASIQRAVATATSWSYEGRFIKPSGEIVWFRGVSTPTALADRLVFRGLLLDVTDRKQLELQIQESLLRREQQVQTSTEIAQEIAAAPALDELFRRVVTLIKERFGYYHAQIFRYDPAQDAVVLVNGYGEIGQQMLAAGHKLPLGRGVVGTAAATGRSMLVTDFTRDPDWRPNPYLPATQGELAVPIKLRDEVLGILDIQSDRAGVLTQEDQLLLEGLCGQIAVAIEQKRTQEALAYERYLLQTLMDNVPAAIYFKDLQSRFIRVSKASARGFGVEDPAEVIGKTDFDFFTEEHARPAYEDEQEIIRTGQIIHKEEYETRIGRPNTWTLTTKMPLRDPQGTIIGTFGISVDTTEVKLAQLRLQEERNLMRSIIDATPDWIFVKDQEHRYQLVNASYARALHLQPEDFIGKNDLEVGFPEDLVKGNPDRGQPGFWPAEQQAMDEDRVVTNSRIPIPLDGVTRIFDDLRVPLHDAEGRIWGVLGVSRDVTEQEQANIRMQETMQELERLYRAATREGWQTLREMRRLAPGYRFDRINVTPADDLWIPPLQRALEENAPVTEVTQGITVAPVTLRGEPIGVLGVQTDPQNPLSPDELTLLQEIIEQGALALENARLFEESQRRALQERLVAEVSGRIRETLDLEAVLRTAAEQIRGALDLEDFVVRLTMPETAQQ